MENLYNRAMCGKLEVVGGSFVFKNNMVEIKLSVTSNLNHLEKISVLSDTDDIVMLMLLNKHLCIISKAPIKTLGDVLVINYEYALYTTNFADDEAYLKDNFKISGVRYDSCGNNTVVTFEDLSLTKDDSLYVMDGTQPYKVSRRDNDRESLTYTKFVTMKLKDLDTIDSTALLLHLQKEHNKNFLYYLGN